MPLAYAGNSSLADLTSQNYVGTSPSQPIVAQTALAQLPPSFPKAMIGAVAPLLGVPADVQTRLTAALPTLPDSVPLSYLYTDSSTFNVEPTTGVVLAIDQDQKWSMQIDTKTGPLQVPVLDLHITPTPSALNFRRTWRRTTSTSSTSWASGFRSRFWWSACCCSSVASC